MLATKVHGRMRPGPERRRPVAQGDPAGDRRQPAPGSAPTTSTSTRSTAGTRPMPIEETMEALHDVVQRRQGPLPRRVVDVRLAVRQGPARRRAARLDAVRLDAEPLQPDLPRGGAGDAPALPRPGRRGDPVEPAGPRPADPPLGRLGPSRSETDEFGSSLYRDEDAARSSTRCWRSPSSAASRRRRWRWPGCSRSRR